MVVGDNESTTTKNADKLLAIWIAMQMWRYDLGRITGWSTSWASIEATGCRHRVNTCITSPWLPPWSMILVENTKHQQKTIFSKLTYSRPNAKVVRTSHPKLDPLLSSLMRQASLKCEMPRLELQCSGKFLAIERCERTKIGKVSNLAQS